MTVTPMPGAMGGWGGIPVVAGASAASAEPFWPEDPPKWPRAGFQGWEGVFSFLVFLQPVVWYILAQSAISKHSLSPKILDSPPISFFAYAT